MRIGPHDIAPGAALAPMAGITNPPFRRLCRELGASLTTTELIFDPQITLPNENVYDGLGHLGNRYVTISLNEFDTIDNDDGLFEREEAGDNTLEGPATQVEKDAVDIVDWSVTVRQLR